MPTTNTTITVSSPTLPPNAPTPDSSLCCLASPPSLPPHTTTSQSLPSEMLVQWTTRDKTSPTVQYGTTPGKYTNSSKSGSGRMQTIVPKDFCGSPASDLGFIAVGQLNYVTIKQLMPDTRYYYRYGDAKHGWSDEASFLTAPEIGIASTLRILAWADSGQVAGDGSYAWDQSDNNPISFSAPNTVQVGHKSESLGCRYPGRTLTGWTACPPDAIPARLFGQIELGENLPTYMYKTLCT